MYIYIYMNKHIYAYLYVYIYIHTYIWVITPNDFSNLERASPFHSRMTCASSRHFSSVIHSNQTPILNPNTPVYSEFLSTDLNSLPSLLTLNKPHSPRTHAVAPHELRCDSPAHSANKAALSLHGVHSPLVPHLSHTPRCRWYALRSLGTLSALRECGDG